jgi:hypothetical protein
MQSLCVVACIVLLASCSRASPSPVVSPERCGYPASGVLASWGKPVVHQIARGGHKNVAKQWHVSLWLTERPAEKRRLYHMSCASSDPLSMVLAVQRPTTFVLVSGRGGPPERLQLGQATLNAPDAAPLRETNTREVMRKIPPYRSDPGPTYLFAFPHLKPSWRQLEFRVPFQGGGGHLRARFKRKACASNAVE